MTPVSDQPPFPARIIILCGRVLQGVHQTAGRLILAGVLAGALAFATDSAAAQTSGGPGQAAPSAPQAAPGPRVPAIVPPDLIEKRSELDALKRELDQIEAGSNEPTIDDKRLVLLRERLQPVSARLTALIDEVSPRAEAQRQRLEQLSPKADEKDRPPESAEVSRERDERRLAFEQVDEVLKRSRVLLVQAEQTATALADRRRTLFAQTVFGFSASALSPNLWRAVVESGPGVLAALASTFGSWIESLPYRLSDGRWAALIIATAMAGLLMIPARRFAALGVRRLVEGRGKTRLTLALGALGVAAAGLIAPSLGAAILTGAIDGFDLAPARITRFIGSMLNGLAAIIGARALVHALFAPGRPDLRLFEAPNVSVDHLLKSVTAFAATLALTRVMEGAAEVVAAPIAISVAIKAVSSLALATVLALSLSRDTARELTEEEACLGPYVPPTGRVRPAIRLALWIVASAIAMSAIAGYIAFSQFIASQTAWTTVVVTIATIVWLIAIGAEEQLKRENSPVALAVRRNIGLQSRSLEQISVIAAGVFKVAVVFVAALLLLAPWGVESGDLLSSIRAVLFGFRVGDVTISLSAIAFGIVIFGLGIIATRAGQRWLEHSFLPTTDLDAGLRNSIRTAFGYVGYTAAVAVGLSSLGLSLDRLAIVAGALSVGIGFGLQSIVNNFVSGLILLWERPIRVGDWIVVGDEQGYVRRINVRSTQIETFERTSVIVPNSNLISGVVKNRVLSDRTGRVALAVTVSGAADPDATRDILLACAHAHPEILSDPPPRVFFKNFSATGIEFDLFAVIPEVETGARVGSDLRFAILRKLREAGIDTPSVQRELELQGAGALEQAIERLADRIDARRAPLREGAAPPTRQRKTARARDADSDSASDTDISTRTGGKT